MFSPEDLPKSSDEVTKVEFLSLPATLSADHRIVLDETEGNKRRRYREVFIVTLKIEQPPFTYLFTSEATKPESPQTPIAVSVKTSYSFSAIKPPTAVTFLGNLVYLDDDHIVDTFFYSYTSLNPPLHPTPFLSKPATGSYANINFSVRSRAPHYSDALEPHSVESVYINFQVDETVVVDYSDWGEDSLRDIALNSLNSFLSSLSFTEKLPSDLSHFLLLANLITSKATLEVLAKEILSIVPDKNKNFFISYPDPPILIYYDPFVSFQLKGKIATASLFLF